MPNSQLCSWIHLSSFPLVSFPFFSLCVICQYASSFLLVQLLQCTKLPVIRRLVACVLLQTVKFKRSKDWHSQLLGFVCSFRLQMLGGTSYLLDTTFKETELWKPCCDYHPTQVRVCLYLMSSIIVEVLIIAIMDENMSKTFTCRSRQVTLTNVSFTKNM